MVISIEGTIAFNKIQNHFMIKITLQINSRKYLSTIKTIHYKSKANVIVNGKV